MRTSTFVWIVVVVVIILGVGWYVYSMPPATGVDQQTSDTTTPPDSNTPSASSSSTSPTGDGDTGSASAAPLNASVTYGASGFSPQEVIVKKGGTVTWTNQSSSGMWVASAQHPTHTVYSGTTLQQHCPDTAHNAFDECAAGSSYSFTFDKVGTWAYHNHANSSQFGRVVVVE